MAEERKIREATAAASERFAEAYAMVALPKVVIPAITEYLNDKGLDLHVVDDGEDDGVAAFVAVMKSAALDRPIAAHMAAFWLNMMVFMGSATLFVVGAALQVAWMVNTLSAFMALGAIAALRAHRQAEMRRRLRAALANRGL